MAARPSSGVEPKVDGTSVSSEARSSFSWLLLWAIMLAGAIDFSGDYIEFFNVSRYTTMLDTNYFQSFSLVLIVVLAFIGLLNFIRESHAFTPGIGAKLFLLFFTTSIVMGVVTGVVRGNETSYVVGDARNLIVYPAVFAIRDMRTPRFADRAYRLFLVVCGIVLVKLAIGIATFVTITGSSPLLIRFLLKLTPYLIGMAMINIAWMANRFDIKAFGMFMAASIGVFMSQTRGLFLGYVGALTFLWLIYAVMNRAHRFVVPAIVVAGAVAFLIVRVWSDPEAQGRFSGENFETTVSIRLEQVDSFMSLFKAHPMFGIGLGGYDPDYTRFTTDTSRPYLQELEYNNLLAKLGVTGIFCLAAAFWFLFYDCWRRIKRCQVLKTKGLLAGLSAGLIGMLIASATNPLYSSMYFHVYIVILLLLLSSARRAEIAPRVAPGASVTGR